MEEPDATQSDVPSPEGDNPPVGTGYAGETTGSYTPSHAEDAEATLVSPAADTEKIGDFEVLGKLGQGGMGAVYRARQISLDRLVALKILPATLEADADFVTRFQREARIAASLSHANLVKVYSSGLADGCHYIAMELIEGETLGQLVKRGPLPPPDALRISLDVARALQCGWDRAQLIHRDIKPGNIFLSERGEVKVGDLGLAKSMAGDTTGLTNTGTAMGTPHYISPEQAKGEKDLDFRADIYSLGCTLYQMLTGRTPYAGTDPMSVMFQHINAPPPAILKVLPQCPIPLARLVGKMLKKIKRERQGSYPELIAEIERVQKLFAPQESVLESTLPPDPDATLLETPVSSTPVTAPVVTQRPRPSKSRALLFGGAGGVVVVAALLAFLLRPKEVPKLTKAELYAQQLAAIPPEPAPAAQMEPATPWVPVFRKFEDLPGNLRAPGSGVKWEDGWIRLGGRKFWVNPLGVDAHRGNYGLRLRFLRHANHSEHALIALRVQPSLKQFYALKLGIGALALHRSDENVDEMVRLADVTPARIPQAGEEGTLEFYAFGRHLIGRAGATTVNSVTDDRYARGMVQIIGSEDLRDVEWIDLEGVSEAEALRIAGVDADGHDARASAAKTAGEGPTPPPWHDLLAEMRARATFPGSDGRIAEETNGFRFLKETTFNEETTSFRNGSLRMTFIPGAMTGTPIVFLRRGVAPDGMRAAYQGELHGKSMAIQKRWNAPGGVKYQRLKEWFQTTELDTTKPCTLELTARDDVLILSLDGQKIGEVQDASLPGSGGFGFFGPAGSLVQKVEYRNDDATPASETAGPRVIKLWDAPEKIPHIDGAKWEDGNVRVDDAGLFHDQPVSRDAIFRTSMLMNPDAEYPQLAVRCIGNPASAASSRYVLSVSAANRVSLTAMTNEKKDVLASWPLPRSYRPEEWARFEVAIRGDELTAKCDGVLLGTVHDTKIAGAGGVLVWAHRKGYFRDIEYVPLDGIAPPTATTKAPPEAVHFGTSSYLVVRKQATWAEAQRLAAGMGGHLAAITSAEEEKWLADTFLMKPVHTVWIGAFRGSDAAWHWISGEPFSYAAWEKRDGVAAPDPKSGRNWAFLHKDPGALDASSARWLNRDDSGEDVNHPYFLVEWEDVATPAASSDTWRPLFPRSQWEGETVRQEYREGMLHLFNFCVLSQPAASPDGVVRAQIVHREGSAAASLVARSSPSQGNYKLELNYTGDSVALNYFAPEKNSAAEKLASCQLPKPLRPGDRYTLEFRLRGDRLTGLYNGTVLVEAVDGRATSAGDWGVYAKEAWYESVEMQGPAPAVPAQGAVGEKRPGATSDGPPALSHATSAGSSPPAIWRDWIAAKRAAGRLTNNPGVVDEGSQIRFLNNGDHFLDGVSSRNSSVRVTWTVPPGPGTPNLFCRRSAEADGRKLLYQLSVGPKTAYVQWRESEGGNDKYHTVAQWPLPAGFDPAQEFTLEFRAIDHRLTGLVNGQEIGSIQDSTVAGPGGVGCFTTAGTQVRRFEYQILDAPAPEPGR